jgi:NTP pyrophosphatase (non-canonical NTP hydrolase)
MTEDKKIFSTPFGRYFKYLDKIDGDEKNDSEYGSMLILGLVEETGEMARAYLAKHGRKPNNLAAQNDEDYKRELGDLLVVILRIAYFKKLDLDDAIMYTLKKIEKRKTNPKK